MNKAIITAVFIIVFSVLSAAQNKWNLEFRPSADYATSDITESDLGAGFGFEALVSYKIIPHLGIYTGWSWNHFSADNSFAGSDAGFEETGYSFGLQFIHPIENLGFSYLLRAGGTYNHIEVENGNGDIKYDSGHGLGWQVEAGIVIPLNTRLSIIPGVRYRSLNRDIDVNGNKVSADLNYLSVGAGLSWSL